MAKLKSLFESQAESTQALDALYAGDYGDVDTEVYESPQESIADDTVVAATPHDTYATHPAGAIAIPADLDDVEFEDEAEAIWFTRRLRNGAVLVVAEVDDEHAETVAQLFRDYGGRTYEKE